LSSAAALVAEKKSTITYLGPFYPLGNRESLPVPSLTPEKIIEQLAPERIIDLPHFGD
jgi:hypothetical protein